MVASRITEVGSDAICVSIIAGAELRYGCARKGSPVLSVQIEVILGSKQLLALEQPSEVRYGAIRAGLEATSTPNGPKDLLIAAHASATEAMLMTAYSREFARVPDLPVQNWREKGIEGVTRSW